MLIKLYVDRKFLAATVYITFRHFIHVDKLNLFYFIITQILSII